MLTRRMLPRVGGGGPETQPRGGGGYVRSLSAQMPGIGWWLSEYLSNEPLHG